MTYKPTNYAERSYFYRNSIIINPNNSTFIANRNNTYGMGLIDRALIGTIIIIIIGGLITLAANALLGTGIGLLVMGLFIYMGFWEWWLAGISFLIGFIIITARSN